MRPHRWQAARLPGPWDSPGKNTGVGCHFLLQCMKVKIKSEAAQSCPTLSDPMDCSLPGSSVHRIFQARVLEWVASAFSGVFCYLVENEHTHPYSSIFSVPQNRGSFIIRKFLSFLKMKSFKNKYWEIFLLLYSSAEKMMCYLRKCLFWLVRNLKQI